MSQKRLATSARSDITEMDIDGTEIAKLQRQLRIMEGDRQAYNNQAQEKIRKQQQEIEKLEKEQGELHRNLAVCMNSLHQQQDSEDAQSLQALLEQKDIVEEELEKEKQSQNDLQKEILSMQSKVAELRKGMVSTSDLQMLEAQKTQKAIHTLEYKLERASTRFSEQLTKNNHLKEELKNLYTDRARFQQLCNRLNMELQEIHKKIGEIISQSTAAYDGRVEAQSKMTTMSEKAVKDLAQYNADILELERVIAHQFNLKEFMSTKDNERNGQGNEHETASRQEPKEQKKVDSGEESLDALEELFERIQTVTGEDNLDLLSTRFIQDEDRNFALLNFVNEQSNEAEALRDQISHIQEEMEQFQFKGLQWEQDRRALLRDTEEKQKETESKAQDYENQANIISKILDEIKTGVNSIVSKMECDRSVIEDKLGSSTGITDNNIMSYLGLVEQKTDRLLTIQAFLNSKDVEKDYNHKELIKFLLSKNPKPHQQNIQPSINSVQYDAEQSPSIDESERPLSEVELRRRIMQGVMQKESSGPQASTKGSKISHQLDGKQHSLEDALL
ncbi:coiled-coil domain-containing protein 114 [Melanotaenia boesemani]|uniref:coiled-coil domain-containing protein 114 n=1 Tax=Melanotaenia boesemani TaxID=1250792 RepID=UPI001C03DB98|nr:coiled-coil domain-containing protein 114 [Melanotaenia boesemani]